MKHPTMKYDYLGYIRRFPAVLTARAIGSKAHAYFEADESAKEVPKVKL